MGRELQHLLFWEQHCCLPSAVGAAEWSRHGSAASRALKGNGRWQEPGSTDAMSWNFIDSIRGHFWGQNVWLLWKKAENGKGCCWLPSSLVYDLGNQYIGDQHLLKAKAWGLPTFLTNWIIVVLRPVWLSLLTTILRFFDMYFIWTFLQMCVFSQRIVWNREYVFNIFLLCIPLWCWRLWNCGLSGHCSRRNPSGSGSPRWCTELRCLYLYSLAVAAGVVWLCTAAPVCLQSFFWQGYRDA